MTPAELKTLREACGLSLPALATIAGVQERTARYWESGHTTVPADVAQAIQQLDAQLTQCAHQAVQAIQEQARARPGEDLECIVLLRYKTDADLHHYRPDMQGLPASCHAAMVYRARSALADAGMASRIVYMNPQDYTAWLAGRPDTEATRAAWAGLQVGDQ